MKKQISVMIALVMIAALALTACSKAIEEPPVTINLPAVSSGEEGAADGVESTGESAETQPGESYPIEGSAAQNPQTQVESTYPTGAVLSDAEIESLVKTNLKDKHTMEFLFAEERTKEEWQQIFTDHIAYGVELTPQQQDQVIDWLMRQ